MDKNFRAVVETFKPIVQLSHKHQVMRLYRKSIRNVNSWCESRELFNEEVTKIRSEFNANKQISPTSPKTVKLMREALERLAQQTHPDPYITNYMPGGTLYMRNPAIPMEALYPDGIPEGVSRRRLNVDMSNIPDDQPYADKVFVDSANKLYWIDK